MFGLKGEVKNYFYNNHNVPLPDNLYSLDVASSRFSVRVAYIPDGCRKPVVHPTPRVNKIPAIKLLYPGYTLQE